MTTATALHSGCEHLPGRRRPCICCQERDAETARQVRGAAIRAIRAAFADPDARRPAGPDGRPISDAEWCIRMIEGTTP